MSVLSSSPFTMPPWRQLFLANGFSPELNIFPSTPSSVQFKLPDMHSQARDGGMFGMLKSCYNFGCSATAAIVAWISDIFLASPLAPFDANRPAVENSVRTALALTGLSLLQRAIPVGVAVHRPRRLSLGAWLSVCTSLH